MLAVEALNQYYGGSHILRDVSLTVTPGKITTLLGRNGVGKTTLLKCLMGVIAPRSGRILWDGAPVEALPSFARVERGFAYVPQGREIFPRLTVEENLQVGGATRPSIVVPDDIFGLFPVLKEMKRRRGGDLSGGQQQQLAIGRALVMRPRLLLLDEPTEGIQPSIIKDIGRAISYLRNLGQIAIILVEQYLDFAQELGDQFLVMDRGSVIYASSRADLDEAALKRAMAI